MIMTPEASRQSLISGSSINATTNNWEKVVASVVP